MPIRFHPRPAALWLAALTLSVFIAPLMAEDAAAKVSREKDMGLFVAGASWSSNLGSEFAGAQGGFSLDRQEDKPVGVLAFNFKDGGLYVAGVTNVEVPPTVAEIRFKVKSDNAAKVLVRLFDDTKQCHQWLLPYNQAGQWQLMRLPLSRQATLHFGGANDGAIHLPAHALWLGVEKSGDAAEGKLLFCDAVTIAGSDAAQTGGADKAGLFDESRTWNLNLGKEFPGAAGGFKLAGEQDQPVAVISYDFTAGGQYVSANTQVAISDAIGELRFSVRGENTATVLIRAIDSTGQCHQWLLPYTDAGRWQPLRLPLAAGAQQHWGGAKDGRIHFPISQFWIGVQKGKSALQGELKFSDPVLKAKSQ